MYRLIQGNSREILKQFPDNHFDSIVTDPPYLIGFLGKAWDSKDNFQLDVYKECLRVLKPGGHILAFSAPRTYHHLAVTLEQAGFEIRDQIMWIYSSGFPKSQDVGRTIQRGLGVKETEVNHWASKSTHNNILTEAQDGVRQKDKLGTAVQVKPTDPLAQQWQGWGTALKPAHEPIALARKPIKTSIAKNVEKYGTGALNIDATRVPFDASDGDPHTAIFAGKGTNWHQAITQESTPRGTLADRSAFSNPDLGRFPSNVIGEIDELYQKYFYCPKVSRRERHIGFEDPGPMFQGSRTDIYQPNKNSPDIQITSAEKKDVPQNNHPTVKPVALMEYLIKLVTPPLGLVLDPFNGSGSTGMAAVGLGFDYVGIDLDPNYIEISKRRIEAWHKDKNPTTFNLLFAEE